MMQSKIAANLLSSFAQEKIRKKFAKHVFLRSRTYSILLFHFPKAFQGINRNTVFFLSTQRIVSRITSI